MYQKNRKDKSVMSFTKNYQSKEVMPLCSSSTVMGFVENPAIQEVFLLQDGQQQKTDKK